MSSAASSDLDGPLEARYGGTDDDDEGVLSSLSLNIIPGRKAETPMAHGKTTKINGRSRKEGRHSVADISGTGPLTLRDQEQVCHLNRKLI